MKKIVRIITALIVSVLPVFAYGQRRTSTPEISATATVIPQILWGVRRVQAEDASDLADIMSRFTRHLCELNGVACEGDWDEAWASGHIARNPESFVIERNGIPVAFFHVPEVDENATGETLVGDVAYQKREVSLGGILGVRVGSPALPDAEIDLVLLRTFRLGMKSLGRMGYKVQVSHSPWMDLRLGGPVDKAALGGVLTPVKVEEHDGQPLLILAAHIDEDTDTKVRREEARHGNLDLDEDRVLPAKRLG